MFVRILLTVIYAAVGVYFAHPLSYWFQSGIYQEMTWRQYVDGGTGLLQYASSFGAIDIYRNTLIGSMIISVTVGRLIEWYFFERNKPKKAPAEKT